MKKTFAILVLLFFSFSDNIYAKNISDCKKLVDAKERLACYESLTTDNTSSDAIIIPSIEKLFGDKKIGLDGGEPFYGCIYFIEYGDEDLLTRKRPFQWIRIGNSKQYAKLSIDDFYEGDEGVPKIGDCFAFTTKWGLGKRSEKEYIGSAKIFSGEYKVDNIAVIKELKNEITVDEYFQQKVSYGSKRITLIGEIEETFATYDQTFGIKLVSKQGKTIIAFYSPNWWKNDNSIKDKLRSIKMGDEIKLKGYFTLGSTSFSILKILD